MHQAGGPSQQFAEGELGHVLGPMRIAAELSPGGGVDKIDMTPDEFSEGCFGPGPDELSEQWSVGTHRGC